MGVSVTRGHQLASLGCCAGAALLHSAEWLLSSLVTKVVLERVDQPWLGFLTNPFSASRTFAMKYYIVKARKR